MLCLERQNPDGYGVGQIGGPAEKKGHCVVSKGVLCGKLVAKIQYTMVILCIWPFCAYTLAGLCCIEASMEDGETIMWPTLFTITR